MNDVRVTKRDNCVLILIDSLSDELKEAIRDQLTSVWHGFVESQDLPRAYSYDKTLGLFFDVYSSKDVTTQMGIIGELLAHILISINLTELESISILKNKEERSIKKGFDIIYFKEADRELWYSEVKSGTDTASSSIATTLNIALLNRAKRGILDIFSSGRENLWYNALIDVNLYPSDEVQLAFYFGLACQCCGRRSVSSL